MGLQRNIPTDFKAPCSFSALKIYVEALHINVRVVLTVVADVIRNREKDLTKTRWYWTRTLAQRVCLGKRHSFLLVKTGSQLWAVLPPGRHLPMSGDILGCHAGRRWRVPLASSEERPGLLLTIPQSTGQPLTTKNHPTRSVNDAEAEKPSSKCIF